MNKLFRVIEGRTYPIRLKLWDLFGDDEKYLKCMFFHRLGYKLNLEKPESFNEKLQWMKLHDHNPLYSKYADKVAVREFVSQAIGEQYLIPCLGIFENASEIEYSILPDRFVLKCNHGAKYNIICKDKKCFNIEEANQQLNQWLQEDFWKIKREFHYKNIPRRIICEQYMEDEITGTLNDYKVFMIGNEPYMIQVDLDRFGEHKRNIYNTNWELLDVQISFPNSKEEKIPKPAVYDEMIECAKKLALGFKEVRVDFYIINNRLYFGEMTFFSGAGFSKYNPLLFEFEMGKKLNIANNGV